MPIWGPDRTPIDKRPLIPPSTYRLPPEKSEKSAKALSERLWSCGICSWRGPIHLTVGVRVLRRQFLQQRLRVLQIERLEALRKPTINRSQQFARLPHLALVAPETREAHGGAQFPGFGLLLAGDGEGALEVRLCFACVSLRGLQLEFSGNTVDLGLPQSFSGRFDCRHRFTNARPSRSELTEFSVCNG